MPDEPLQTRQCRESRGTTGLGPLTSTRREYQVLQLVSELFSGAESAKAVAFTTAFGFPCLGKGVVVARIKSRHRRRLTGRPAGTAGAGYQLFCHAAATPRAQVSRVFLPRCPFPGYEFVVPPLKSSAPSAVVIAVDCRRLPSRITWRRLTSNLLWL